MTNTSRMEVLFEELCDEQIASISGGINMATATVTFTENSVKVQASSVTPTPPTSSPSPTNSVFDFGPLLENPPNSQSSLTLNLNGIPIYLVR